MKEKISKELNIAVNDDKLKQVLKLNTSSNASESTKNR
jgi:hypothetical protein